MKKIIAITILSVLGVSNTYAERYVLMAHKNQLSNYLVSQVEAIGGVVIDNMQHIDMLVVDSDSKDFERDSASIYNVQYVFKDIELNQEDLFSDANNAQNSSAPNSFYGDMFSEFQWNLQALQAPETWALGYRGAGVRIAVLDTGVDADNIELVENINTELAKSFIEGESWDASPSAVFHHGTIITTALAAKDNGVGIIGVAPDAEIVPVKIVSDDGSRGSLSNMLSGIYYATEIQADIINMSLGAHISKAQLESKPIKKAFKRATRYAWRQGAVVIAALGNDGLDLNHDTKGLHLPAELKNVVAISGTGPVGRGYDQTVSLDSISSYSNYGRRLVDFAAPGGNDKSFLNGHFENCIVSWFEAPCFMFDEVVAIDNNGQVMTTRGTSIAAAQASGVAALIISKIGKNKPRKVIKKMIIGAEDNMEEYDPTHFGYGRLNAYRSVK
ncbi:S8 family peptidase [Thalassotalea ganghwensis]